MKLAQSSLIRQLPRRLVQGGGVLGEPRDVREQ